MSAFDSHSLSAFLRNVPAQFSSLRQDFFVLMKRSEDTKIGIVDKNTCRALLALIRDRKVIIIGSGPSLTELDEQDIPDDFLVMTCNMGLAFFNLSKRRKIDVFYATQYTAQVNRSRVLKAVKKANIGVIISPDPQYFEGEGVRAGQCLSYKASFMPDERMNFDLKARLSFFIEYLWRRGLRNRNKVNHVFLRRTLGISSGMCLLKCALLFKAKEIYLAGLDIGADHFYGKFEPENRRFADNLGMTCEELADRLAVSNGHLAADQALVSTLAKKYYHIYSAVCSSPITEHVPYRSL